MTKDAMLIRLVTPKRGSLATHLPNAFARKNAALIAYVKAKKCM